VYQVGIVTLGNARSQSALWRGFIESMRELGYVDGRNLVLRLAFAAGKLERLPGLVAGLVEAKVDVIPTTSTQETLEAKRATATIRIVMTLVPDPIGLGLVARLARPGGNITGLTNLIPGLNEKYVELLPEVVPRASRLTVIGGGPSGSGPFPGIRRELQDAAERFGMTLSFTNAQSPADFDAVLERAKNEGSGGIVVPLGATTYAHRAKLVQLALKHRLPGIYWDRGFVEDGGLMTYSASLEQVGRRAAYFVDRLLRGANPPIFRSSSRPSSSWSST
jgi:putative ABC transport system substrate-binding protein